MACMGLAACPELSWIFTALCAFLMSPSESDGSARTAGQIMFQMYTWSTARISRGRDHLTATVLPPDDLADKIVTLVVAAWLIYGFGFVLVYDAARRINSLTGFLANTLLALIFGVPFLILLGRRL